MFKMRRGPRFVLAAPDNNQHPDILHRRQHPPTVYGKYLDDGRNIQMCQTVYAEFYTLIAQVGGFVLPLVYCLLRDKTAETYRTVFRRLLGYANVLGVQHRPATINRLRRPSSPSATSFRRLHTVCATFTSAMPITATSRRPVVWLYRTATARSCSDSFVVYRRWLSFRSSQFAQRWMAWHRMLPHTRHTAANSLSASTTLKDSG